MKPEVGLTLFNLREHIKTQEGLDETLGRVKGMGYNNVQVSGCSIEPKIVRELTDKHELKIVASHEGAKQIREDFDAIVNKLRTFGCDFTALGSPGGIFDWKDGDPNALVSELKTWGEKFKAEGIKFGFHNHEMELAKYNGRTLLATIYEDTPPDVLYAELDLHWVTRGGGSPVAWINKVAGRMPVVHIKDFAMDATERKPYFCEIGEGNLDWPAIIDALTETGVNYMVVEQDREVPERDIFASMELSYKNLSAMGLK
jgi:sugar phosphate isomerase/epimerase